MQEAPGILSLRSLQWADGVVPTQWFGHPYLTLTWALGGENLAILMGSIVLQVWDLDNPMGSPRLGLREGSGCPEAKELAEVWSCSGHLELGGTSSLLTAYFPWFLQPCPPHQPADVSVPTQVEGL